MSRVKLTEYKSKALLYQELGFVYDGVAATINDMGSISYTTPLTSLSSDKKYVVKVDQGVKGRMKKGLVVLQVTSFKLQDTIKKLAGTGYTRFIIEEMVEHDQKDERYISIERVREGLLVRFSKVGGIEIEGMKDKVEEAILNSKSKFQRSKFEQISKTLGVTSSFLQSLLDYFELNYISFLEINPLVIQTKNEKIKGKIINHKSFIHVLDLAVEVDSTAQFFVRSTNPSVAVGEGGLLSWDESDIVGDHQKSNQEISIKKLNDKSQAALSFTLLNPDGSIWVLLSGGGASITLADEFYNLGFGKELGNYGEYSGNPNAEETYLYTRDFLKAMFASKSKKKIILVGGGVANFTDIRVTFLGILRAFEEVKEVMKKQKVLVFVRRGGPMEKEGLAMMTNWLKENEMYGYVAGPELPLHEIVRRVVRSL